VTSCPTTSAHTTCAEPRSNARPATTRYRRSLTAPIRWFSVPRRSRNTRPDAVDGTTPRPTSFVTAIAVAAVDCHADTRRSASPSTREAQPGVPAQAPALSAQDYAEIQQLSARYAFDIDTCVNAGNDFADLFTDDGEFSVSQQWGVAGNRKTKGRAALMDAAGGDGKGGCKDPKTTMGYGISHIIVNLVITPTPEGATGKSYLLAIGVGGDPTTIERQGGYEDVYVKTPAGWKFKQRTLFPARTVVLSTSGEMSARGRRSWAWATWAAQSATPRKTIVSRTRRRDGIRDSGFGMRFPNGDVLANPKSLIPNPFISLLAARSCPAPSATTWGRARPSPAAGPGT